MTTRTKRKPPMTDAEREDAARLIMDDYLGFLLGGPRPGEEGDPKAFAGRHTAAKDALAHLDQLMKVAGGTDEEAGAAEAAGGHLGDARAAMASLEGEEAEVDDSGDG